MKYLSLLCFIVCAFMSCSEESKIPIPEDSQEIIDELSLQFPLEDDAVDYCCFSMRWKDETNNLPYTIQISEDEDFDSLLLDTIVSDAFFDFPDLLNPAKTYYWKVKSSKEDESSGAKFSVKDYVALLEGEYKAIHKYKYWVSSNPSDNIDTIYETTLTIFEGNEEGSISYSTESGQGRTNLSFSNEINKEYVVYKKHHVYPRYKDFLTYSFDNDSIYIMAKIDANGGGSLTTIKAKISD
ncbi:MAG: hypothetical protein AAGA77_00425 [Bacteroidota bacterium]